MPFGRKPFKDGSERFYDFDKIYRVVIQRAIRQSGLEPIRADERKGSSIIHTEMFKDLRDQPVVLADLSLENPNVFYELGIRHVMSGSGTVLICQEGSPLPFDVQLSRVVFYRYDGESLDWEEAERVVAELQSALQVAKGGQSDSPVHALLESVMPLKTRRQEIGHASENEERWRDLDEYQKMLAEKWKAEKDIGGIIKRHRKSVFGARTLAYLVLQEDSLLQEAETIARQLQDMQQYDLANRLFEKLRKAGRLGIEDLLRYASSYSEEHADLAGLSQALKYSQQARQMLDENYPESDGGNEKERAAKLWNFYRRFAGLRQWQWWLTKDPKDLNAAIEAFNAALQHMSQVKRLDVPIHIGFAAQAHLKLMILLRIQDNDPDRPDLENHREAILNMKADAKDPLGASYLRWYQSIVLADSGMRDVAQKKAISAVAQDLQLTEKGDYAEIGRRQYVQLRRFLEQYSGFLHYPSAIGLVSQVLQDGQRKEA